MGRSILNRKRKSDFEKPHSLNDLSQVQLLAFSAAVLCYLNSLPGEFVFDDREAIVRNGDVRSSVPLTSVFLNDFWGTPMKSNASHKSYRPITIITFRWNFFFGGLNPVGYHIVNIILHSLTTVLFFQLSLKLFHGCIFPSALSGIIFAVHPIHTEAVTSVVGRADVLCAAFYLLAILSYTKCFPVYNLQGFDKPFLRPSRYSRLWLCATLIFTVLSLLSKEMGVTVLAVCFLYDVCFICQIGKLQLHHLTKYKASSKPLPKWIYSLLERVAVLVITCVFLLLVRVVFIGGTAPQFVESDNPTSFHPDVWTRLRTYSYVISLNGWLLLCPSNLCYDWSMDSIPRIESYSDVRNLLPISLAVILFSLTLYGLNQQQSPVPSTLENQAGCKNLAMVQTGILDHNHNLINEKPQLEWSEARSNGHRLFCFSNTATSKTDRQTVIVAVGMLVIPFLPASNLFFPVGFVLAERILYIPSMGYSVLAALGISRLFHNQPFLSSKNELQVQSEHSSQQEGPRWSSLTLTGQYLALGLLLVLSLKTVHRNTEWLNTQTLAEAGLKDNPQNAKIHLTMANALAQKGELSCEAFYREALRLRPQYAAAWTNLGLVLLNTGRASEAEDAYIKALSFRPGSGDANTNYAHLLRVQERYREADDQYRRALVIRPNNPQLLHFHAVVLEKLGKQKEAEIQYGKACSVSQDDPPSCAALGRMLAAPLINSYHTSQSGKKRIKMAEKYLRKSLSVKADDNETQLLLGTLLWQVGKLDQAEVELRQLLIRNPHSTLTEYTLGRVLESKGVYREAKLLYRQVLKKDHTHSGARQALERLLGTRTKREFLDTTTAAILPSH